MRKKEQGLSDLLHWLKHQDDSLCDTGDGWRAKGWGFTRGTLGVHLTQEAKVLTAPLVRHAHSSLTPLFPVASWQTVHAPIPNPFVFCLTPGEAWRGGRGESVRSIKCMVQVTCTMRTFHCLYCPVTRHTARRKSLKTLIIVAVTHSDPTELSSSDWLVSSSDWSLRRSQGRMAEESAISRTGPMLGLRLSPPFSVGRVSLLHSSGGSGFCRSMATVPERTRMLM